MDRYSLRGMAGPGASQTDKTIQSLGFAQSLGSQLDSLEESGDSPPQTPEAKGDIRGTMLLAVKDIQSAIKSLF
jgi:hypothetical protein